MAENAVAKQVDDVAFRAHRALGPGLLESVYEAILASELQKCGLSVIRQQAIPVVDEGTRFEMGFRADPVVQDSLIVEIKSIAEVAPVHHKQLLPYLRLSGKRLGRIDSRQAAKNAKKDVKGPASSASSVAATGRARCIRGHPRLRTGLV